VPPRLGILDVTATEMRKLTATHVACEQSDTTVRLVASHMTHDAETARKHYQHLQNICFDSQWKKGDVNVAVVTRLCMCALLLQLPSYLRVTECAGIWAWSELCIRVRLRVDLLSTLALPLQKVSTHTKSLPDLHSLRFLELFLWKRERKCCGGARALR